MYAVMAAGATASQTQPGFYLMVAVIVAGAVGSLVVAWRNHHPRR